MEVEENVQTENNEEEIIDVVTPDENFKFDLQTIGPEKEEEEEILDVVTPDENFRFSLRNIGWEKVVNTKVFKDKSNNYMLRLSSPLSKELMRDFTYRYYDSIIIAPKEEGIDPEDLAPGLLTDWNPREHVVCHQWLTRSKGGKSSKRKGGKSSKRIWCGAFARFKRSWITKAVASLVKSKSKSTVIYFTHLLDILLKAEHKFPNTEGETTMVIFKAKKLIPKRHYGCFDKMVVRFGEPTEIIVHDQKRGSEIARVVYPYRFQAYAAFTALNGLVIHPPGKLKLRIELTENGKQFDSYVQRHYRKLLRR